MTTGDIRPRLSGRAQLDRCFSETLAPIDLQLSKLARVQPFCSTSRQRGSATRQSIPCLLYFWAGRMWITCSNCAI